MHKCVVSTAETLERKVGSVRLSKCNAIEYPGCAFAVALSTRTCIHTHTHAHEL